MSDFATILDEVDEPDTTETPTPAPTSDAPVVVSEAPEDRADTTVEPVADTDTPVTREDGATWSEKAQRWYKDGKIVAGEKPAPPVAPVDQTPPSAAPAAAPEPKGEKFRYRYSGTTHELDGFEYDPATGRVTVAPEHVPILRDAMNARHVLSADRDINAKLRQDLQAKTQELEHTRTLGTSQDAKAKALIDHYSTILSEPDEEKALTQFFQLRANFPTLLAKAEADHWRRMAEAGKAPTPEKPTTPAHPTDRAPASALPERTIAVQRTADAVEELKLDHAFRDLTAEHWKQMSARCERTPYAYLRPATAEEATQYGVTVGEIVFDDDAFRADVQEYAGSIRAMKKASEAAAFNKANAPLPMTRTTTTVRPAKATVTTPAGTPAPWDQSFKRAWDDLDLDDE